MKELKIDCFAGGGGTSVGIEMALGRAVELAINHDPQAIRMFSEQTREEYQRDGSEHNHSNYTN